MGTKISWIALKFDYPIIFQEIFGILEKKSTYEVILKKKIGLLLANICLVSGVDSGGAEGTRAPSPRDF